MRWFRENTGARPEELTPDAQDVDDSPPALRRSLADLIRLINQRSGQLPGEAVVRARWITDTLDAIVDVPEGRSLDIQAVVLIRGIVDDYLPTTIQSYLAIAEEQRDSGRLHGGTPTATLLEQIEVLQNAASDMLGTTREEHLDMLASQANFLRTKFTRSDLDLR